MYDYPFVAIYTILVMTGYITKLLLLKIYIRTDTIVGNKPAV